MNYGALCVSLVLVIGMCPQILASIETGLMNEPSALLPVSQADKPFQPSRDLSISIGNSDMKTSYFSDLSVGIIHLYGVYLRPALSRGCPCTPSCSEYMLQAIHETGFPIGYVLGLERLLHETGEIHHGLIIQTGQGFRVFDPLENNTFWWR